MNLRDPKVYIPATIAALVILSLGGTGIYYLAKEEKRIKIDVVLDKFINYHEDLINEQDKCDIYIGEYIENHNLPNHARKQNEISNLDIRKKGFGSIFYHMNGGTDSYEAIDFLMYNNNRFSKSEAVGDGSNFKIKSKFKDSKVEIGVYLGFLKDGGKMTYSEFFSLLPVNDNYIAVFRQSKDDFKNMFRKFKEEYTNLQTLEAKNDIYVIHNLEDDDVVIDLY